MSSSVFLDISVNKEEVVFGISAAGFTYFFFYSGCSLLW